MKKLYIAGPAVFERNPKELGEKLKSICAAHGFMGLFPMDGQLRVDEAATPFLKAMAIYKADVALIDECDGVIADYSPFRGPSLDSGTCFEIGYAIAQGKPVFGYSKDSRNYFAKVHQYFDWKEFSRDEDGTSRDPLGMMVENDGLQDNLMQVGAALQFAPISSSFEEALAAASIWFRNTQK